MMTCPWCDAHVSRKTGVRRGDAAWLDAGNVGQHHACGVDGTFRRLGA